VDCQQTAPYSLELQTATDRYASSTPKEEFQNTYTTFGSNRIFAQTQTNLYSTAFLFCFYFTESGETERQM
jgi:hypothetical protein